MIQNLCTCTKWLGENVERFSGQDSFPHYLLGSVPTWKSPSVFNLCSWLFRHQKRLVPRLARSSGIAYRTLSPMLLMLWQHWLNCQVLVQPDVTLAQPMKLMCQVVVSDFSIVVNAGRVAYRWVTWRDRSDLRWIGSELQTVGLCRSLDEIRSLYFC